MGEFLNKSRKASNNHQNLHQSQQTQLKPLENKQETKPEEEASNESPEAVFQRKWDSFGGDGESRSQRRGPVPLMNTEEEKPIQRRGPVPLQFHSSEEEEKPVQKKGPVPPMNFDSDEHTHSDSSSSDKMPLPIQRKMESSFGEDFSGVNIHTNSSQSKRLNAHAFTKGSDIHFAPGMYSPESQKGQELLGHELTHVVQQREGRVQPTVQKKGVNINDDEGLEKEADEMGEKAASGEADTKNSDSSAEDNIENSNEGEQQNDSGAKIIVGVDDGTPIGNSDEIKKIQSSLKLLGYYTGSEDGIITRKDGKESDTVKAIRAFQKDHQLTETGNVDVSANALIDNLVSALPHADSVKEVSSNSDQKSDPNSLEAFFLNYENFARIELNHWYSENNDTPKEKRIDASFFSKEARRVYSEKKDLSYVVPVQYALAQLKLEGGLKGDQRTKSNVFNVYAYDSGVSESEKKIDTLEKGFSAYYSLMADRFLTDKGADPLLENGKFLNKDGGVYATNPFYEIEIKSEIGMMYYRASEYKLSSSVGAGGKNKPGDVKIVGSLLNKAGFLSEDKIENVQAVSSAILTYQKQEMVPKDEKWFKDREKEVTDDTDKGNVKTKKDKFADGCIGMKGQTIGLLYYQTVLNNKIPDLTLERDKENLEKADKKEATSPKKATPTKEEINKQIKTSTKEDKNPNVAATHKFELPKVWFEKYKRGEINIIGLGKGLVPHGPNNGGLVLQVFEQMDYLDRDNLAYVMTKSSPDSFLSQYNRELLSTMAEYLSGYFNTLSWGENSEQAARIYRIIKPEVKASIRNDNNKFTTSIENGSWKDKKFKIDSDDARIRDEKLAEIKDDKGKPKLIPNGTEITISASKVVSGDGYILAKGFGWTSRANVEGKMANETFGVEKANYDSLNEKHKTVGSSNAMIRKQGPKYEEIKGEKIAQGSYVVIKEESQDTDPKGKFVKVSSVVKNSNGTFVEGGTLGWTAKSNLVDGWADFKSYNAEWERGSYIGQTDVVNIAGTEGIEQISSKTLEQFFILRNAAKLDGIELKIGDGFREYHKQEKLWDANPDPEEVARPGRSNHQHGQALDLNTGGFNTKVYQWLKEKGPEFGWIRTVNNEHWHWEYRPNDAKEHGYRMPNIN